MTNRLDHFLCSRVFFQRPGESALQDCGWYGVHIDKVTGVARPIREKEDYQSTMFSYHLFTSTVNLSRYAARFAVIGDMDTDGVVTIKEMSIFCDSDNGLAVTCADSPAAGLLEFLGGKSFNYREVVVWDIMKMNSRMHLFRKTEPT